MAAATAGSIFQTAFAALSFAGAGFLFQKLNKNGYEAEMERHNTAMEELTKAQEEFQEQEIKRKDRIQELRMELADANNDMLATNKSLEFLKTQMDKQRMSQEKRREPVLSDYYKPSKEMKEYQEVVEVAMGLGVGALAWYII